MNELIGNETICAISTGRGQGAVAMVRVSGQKAIAIVDEIFKGRRRLSDVATHTLHYGEISDETGVIDYVLVAVFIAPQSYTGEDMVEISCHGSLYIQNTILQQLIKHGARLARAGEFTKRAFLNGKMDLTQAEAVADLIASQSKMVNDLAINQLRGGIRVEIDRLRDKLLSLSSLLEMELDFSDQEDVKLVKKADVSTLIDEISAYIETLLSSFATGNAVKNGIGVVIVGEPNVGKSTLLNRLLNEERAIVSDLPGTTRDTIEDTLILDGFMFRFIDTAGIRQSSNTIEQIGIERAKAAIKKANVILYLSDIRTSDQHCELDDYLASIDKPMKHIWSKTDLRYDEYEKHPQDLYLSLLTDDIEPIRKWLVEYVKGLQMDHQTLITNSRHYDALSRALAAIKDVKTGLERGVSNEFLTLDLRICTDALGEISGQIRSEDILQNIFSKFCIGK